jgi:hypothetical protein
MSNRDPAESLRQCDIVFRDDDYARIQNASNTSSDDEWETEDEWEPSLNPIGEEALKLLKSRAAYSGYAHQHKGDLQSVYYPTC